MSVRPAGFLTVLPVLSSGELARSSGRRPSCRGAAAMLGQAAERREPLVEQQPEQRTA